MQKIVHFLPEKEENSKLFNDYPGVKNCCFMRFHPLLRKRHTRVALLINRASIFRGALYNCYLFHPSCQYLNVAHK